MLYNKKDILKTRCLFSLFKFIDADGTNGVLYVPIEKRGKIKFTYPLKSTENDKICTL